MRTLRKGMRALAATGNELTNLRQLKAYADSVTADISEAVAAETSKRELQDELLTNQIAAKLSTVARDDTLSGDGTSGNKMGVATGMTPATAIYDTNFNLDDVNPAYYGKWVIVGNNTKGTKPEPNFMGYCLALVRDANSVSEVVFTSESADRIYYRRRYDNSWSQWQTVAYLSDIDDLVSESDLTSKLQPYATTSSMTAAIGEESKAREKQDQLLEDQIATKLGVGNIRSGEGIAVSSESTNVTISGTLASHDAPGMMSAADKTRLDGMDEAISSAVSEEASARESADSGLSARIDGKIAASDIKAGANVSVSAQGNVVTVAATVPDVSGFMKKTEADAAYAPKSHTHTAEQITGLTANRALISDANGHPSASAVTNTELGYLGGVTSGVQSQLNGKLDSDGNAVSASKLQTARTINGTSFDGTANITTANWGTARTITIGESGKSVNGSGNVSWSLDEIGAAPKSHTHSASQITSGTLDAARIPTITDGKIQSVSASKLTGVIPTENLPGYVDDVVEYDSQSAFPKPGEAGKIYVATDTNRTYRWGGSEYVEISASLALGTTSSTAFRGDYGQTAYSHAQAKGSAFASGLYKITTNAQGHVTAATAVTKSDITALGIPGQDTNTTYSAATTSTAGLMSASDKAKLDGIASNATHVTIDSSFSTTSTNPVQNKVIKAALDGKAASTHNHSAAQITSGTLSTDRLPTVPIAKGGTGATDAGAARTALGVDNPVHTPAQLSSEDLNNLASDAWGMYYSGGGNNVKNKPSGVGHFGLMVMRSAGGVTTQILTAPESNALWVRTNDSGSWQSWSQVYSTGHKPSASDIGAAASSHTHPASQITGLTADRALISDGNGHPAVSAVTNTELGYLDGVTSNVQTQLNGKLSTSGTAAAASKLATARTISLTGNVTGSASFDGTANASITATIANGAVNTARLADTSVSTAKLADKAVTPAKMASDPVYIVRSASDTTSISGKTVVKPCVLVVTGGDVPQIVYAS